MLELIYKNDYTTISGDYTREIVSMVNEECSYVVPSAEWSPKYQMGAWDGKISLFNKKSLSFPSGLLSFVEKMLKDIKINYKIVDQRNLPSKKNLAKVDLGNHKFRDYQEEAINKIKERHRGILAMATGAGKTKSACGIISELSVYPVIFVVPSVSLLKQTVKEFKESLKPIKDSFSIGEIGGGSCILSPNGVNVCTYQTLLTAFDKKYSEQKKKIIDIEQDTTSLQSLQKQLKLLNVDLNNSPTSKIKSIQKKINDVEKKIKSKLKMHQDKADIRKLVENCQLLIIDETHIAAEIIECISLNAKSAYYKCGLSATPNRTDNTEKRMFGATGPVIHRITASDLINRGFLVRPYIYMIDLDCLDKSSMTYQETYKSAIVLNEQRNELIRDLAEEMHAQGRPTIIMVERIEHGKILEEMIENALFVPGGSGDDDKPIPEEELDYRRYQLDRLEKNEHILICTSWAFTGVDAPKVSCLILGCSIASPITTMQQIGRVLRKAEGKRDCIIIDFKHKEKSLKNHAISRMKVYKTEQAFEIKTLKFNNSKGSYV